ncbi:hypothetical protein GCM10012287_48520 [Streptomyces daqingensis]|uniref:DUF397 domain-containing protein n=1 Tax=Streptomyces daqingensis TaxID=1472640 RepID=A0ABQ2MQ57_9ACTN|nr:DUF397 domain-containing protein [Streptomyces daqingensis]GGO55985.1 hypothetical protein GCM10012287_48520 [Streptomyces daqingensis]
MENRLTWVKSSYSGTEGGACVEVAASRVAIHVRDSKSAYSPVLTVPAPQWARFVRYAAAAHEA